MKIFVCFINFWRIRLLFAEQDFIEIDIYRSLKYKPFYNKILIVLDYPEI
jgi:hypothetical protein